MLPSSPSSSLIALSTCSTAAGDMAVAYRCAGLQQNTQQEGTAQEGGSKLWHLFVVLSFRTWLTKLPVVLPCITLPTPICYSWSSTLPHTMLPCKLRLPVACTSTAQRTWSAQEDTRVPRVHAAYVTPLAHQVVNDLTVSRDVTATRSKRLGERTCRGTVTQAMWQANRHTWCRAYASASLWVVAPFGFGFGYMAVAPFRYVQAAWQQYRWTVRACIPASSTAPAMNMQ